MNLKQTLSLGVLGMGLAMSPVLSTLARAADEPPKDNPPARPEKPGGDTTPRPGGRGQGGAGGAQRDPSAMIDRYKEAVDGLKLTDEQKPKVASAFETAKKGFDDLKANPPEGQERLQAYMKINTALRESVQAVLTDDQKKELAAKMPQRGGGLAGRGAGGGLAFMKQNLEQLGLSDEQKTKVETVFKDVQEKIDALTKDAAGDRAAIREKVAPLMTELQKKVEDLLTPEQKEKQTKLREEMRQRFQGGGGNRPPADGAAKPAEKKEL